MLSRVTIGQGAGVGIDGGLAVLGRSGSGLGRGLGGLGGRDRGGWLLRAELFRHVHFTKWARPAKMPGAAMASGTWPEK